MPNAYAVGYYTPTPAFQAIPEHVCVMRGDQPGGGTPVAICGRAGEAQAFATVAECPHCGETHEGLFRHRGHQGRSDYVFCAGTGKPVETHARPLVVESAECTHVRAGNLIWPRSVDDDLPF